VLFVVFDFFIAANETHNQFLDIDGIFQYTEEDDDLDTCTCLVNIDRCVSSSIYVKIFVLEFGKSDCKRLTDIHVRRVLTLIVQKTIESVILDRYGQESVRIFRFLVLKKHLEEKQV
tara:strand:- start:562 stop:912 length:351 start_codon:yes stop_codon:yes gene_type:complete